MFRTAILTLTALLASFVAIVTLAEPAAATHNRATQITWHQTGPNTVEFHSVISFRASYFDTPPVGSTISEPCLEFGDGDAVCEATVETLDVANDVLTAEVEVAHTYATSGPYIAAITGCCRLSPPAHINNGDLDFRASTTVDLSTTDANPVSSISPIVDCAKDAICSFKVPAVDPDGATMRYRLATSEEATGYELAFVQPGPPYAPNAASINPNTGVYTWNTTGATLNSDGGDTYYSTQVMIEKLSPAGAVVTQSPVDFFIRIGAAGNAQPEFLAPTPADGSIIAASVGQPVSFPLKASDPDTGDTVTLALIGQPSGATLGSTPGNPANGTFTWTPTTAGQAILTLTATDQRGLQATQRSVIINVTGGTTSSPTMTGRAFGLSANVFAFNQSGVLVPKMPDTKEVSTTTSMTVSPECARGPQVVALCSRVVADAATRTVTADAQVLNLNLLVPHGIPAHVPFGPIPFPSIVAKAVEATSTSTCAGSTGALEVAYLKIGTKVLIGSPTQVKPNTTINVGLARVVLNEQIPSAGPGNGLTVNAVHIYAGSRSLLGSEVILGSARSGISGC